MPVYRMLQPPHPRSGRMCPVQGHREGLGLAAMKAQGNAGPAPQALKAKPAAQSVLVINPAKIGPPTGKSGSGHCRG
jgi:hypothetical protein